MDYTFVLCPNLIGILGLSILLVFSRFNYYLEKIKLRFFKAAAIINIVIIVVQVADFVLGYSDFSSAYLFRRFTSSTGFALSPIFPLLLARIVSNEKLPRWIYIPAALNVIMSYSSSFTGHLFFIDQRNIYFRGPLFAVMLAIVIFYILFLMYFSFKNLTNMRASESTLLVGVAVIVVACVLLEMVFSFHFLLWNSCAVLLICYYLFFHIQYFKYDPLTNVLNRNVYSAALDNLKNTTNVGVISFDLDHLKIINDTDGHERGDEYIITSAHLMNRCFSDIGHLYRIGGDEFVVLASGTTEKIIQNRIDAFDEECLKEFVSISCGYSFNVLSDDMDQMLRDADEAMYENKRRRKLNHKIQITQ